VTEIRTAAVVGLGLIGGSLARDLAARGVRVLGWDQDARTLRTALDAGIVDELREGEEAPDVAVVAVPVLATPDVLRRFLPALAAARLVTDTGSTKRSVVSAAEALGIGDRFIGSHPLAGDHRSGWDASRAGLFDGALVYLTPTSISSDEAKGLARTLWETVGARPETLDAGAHDRLLAWSSHLPQAVSSALAIALGRAGIPREALGPGGRDATRLAGSSPEMWAQIAADNADHLAPALAAIENEIRELRMRVEGADPARLRAWFADGGGGGGA
jgi:prephenate dehydrogenase